MDVRVNKNDDNTGETIRTDDSSSNSINVYYQTKLATGRWLPVVKNNEDYAGIRGQNITGLAITTDHIKIQMQKR